MNLFKKIWKWLWYGNYSEYIDVLYHESNHEVHKDKESLQPNAFIANSDIKICTPLEDVYDRQVKSPLEDYQKQLFEASTKSARVYIYNISPVEHHRTHSIFPNIVMPACPVGKKYELAFSLPEIIVVTKFLVDNNETDFLAQDGKRIAMDIINPDNFGLDQNTKTYGYSSSGDTNNLSKRGVFWSMSFPPKEKELEEARSRMVSYYRSLLEKVNIKCLAIPEVFNFYIEEKGYAPKKAQELAAETVVITPEEHAAAEYLRVKTIWHPILEPKYKGKKDSE